MCLVPTGAGVGSAIGFLKAPFGYEALASNVTALSAFDPYAINAMLDDLKSTAEGFVRSGTDGAITREVVAFMRYAGQGWEIPVPLPDRAFDAADAGRIEAAFRDRYTQFFGRAVEGPEIEFVTWSVKAQDSRPAPDRIDLITQGEDHVPAVTRDVFDPASGKPLPTAIVERAALGPGDRVSGPAVIAEEETSTVVTTPFDAVVQPDGTLLLIRKGL